MDEKIIDHSEIPRTPQGSVDMDALNKYDRVCIGEGMYLKSSAITNASAESDYSSDVSDINDDEIDNAKSPEEIVKALLRSPMIEDRKRKSVLDNDSLKINPVRDDINETAEGIYYNYEKRKRESIGGGDIISESKLQRNLRSSINFYQGERKENFDNSMNLLVRAVDDSRDLLENEHQRLLLIMSDWRSIMESETIPDNDRDEIRSVICRAQIFFDKRFKSTLDICDQAEEYVNRDSKMQLPDDKHFRADDIYGFCDLAISEIKKIDQEFDRIVRKRDNNWLELPIEKKKPEKGKIVYNVKKSKLKPSTVKSRINKKFLAKFFKNKDSAELVLSDSRHVDPIVTESLQLAEKQNEDKRGNDESLICQQQQSMLVGPKTPPINKATIRNRSVIKSATGTPVHVDTPRPGRIKKSNTAEQFAKPLPSMSLTSSGIKRSIKKQPLPN